MIRRINESNSFTDVITSNPTWQMVNRIVKGYGYEFDPYARIEVYNNGKKVLEDINFRTDDEELPDIDVTTNGFKLEFELNVNEPIKSLDFDEYIEYTNKLVAVTDMIDELSDINFSTLYEDYIDMLYNIYSR